MTEHTSAQNSEGARYSPLKSSSYNVPVLHLQLVPLAIQTAIEEDVEFRKGLPLGYSNYVGVANSEKVF